MYVYVYVYICIYIYIYIYRELVARQALESPLADGALVHEELHHLNGRVARHAPLLHLREEGRVELVAELGVEGAAVDDEAADAGHVADQALAAQREVLGVLGPPQ